MRATRLLFFLTLILLARAAVAGDPGAEAPPANAPESASTAEIERLRKVMLEEQEVIANCMKRIDELEKTKTSQDKAGINSVKLNGDFRYRFEDIHTDPKTFNTVGVRGPLKKADQTKDRFRHRLRLRLGFEWTVNDEVTVGGRLATSMNAGAMNSGDPISYNQTMTDAFSKKGVYLDTAYFDYHPARVPGLKVMGGKMSNPFYVPGKTQMIWDQDLTPEGLAVTYTNTMESSPTGPVYREVPLELAATAGYFLVQERSIDVETQLLGVQGSAKYNFEADGSTSLMVGASYYDYGHLKGFPPLLDPANSFGNALSLAVLGGSALYGDDFNIVEGFTEFTIPVFERPLALYGDIAYNTAKIDKNYDGNNSGAAWALGASYGRCVTPRSWSLHYEYRDLGRDAVVGAFTDSDFGGGGTNSKGHVLGADFMLLKNTRLAVTYFINHNMGSDWLRMVPTFGGKEKVDGPYQRLQVDLNFKF